MNPRLYCFQEYTFQDKELDLDDITDRSLHRERLLFVIVHVQLVAWEVVM